jgi:hypothetical protein
MALRGELPDFQQCWRASGITGGNALRVFAEVWG